MSHEHSASHTLALEAVPQDVQRPILLPRRSLATFGSPRLTSAMSSELCPLSRQQQPTRVVAVFATGLRLADRCILGSPRFCRFCTETQGARSDTQNILAHVCS